MNKVSSLYAHIQNITKAMIGTLPFQLVFYQDAFQTLAGSNPASFEVSLFALQV